MQRPFDFLHGQRLTNHTGGIWQHSIGVDTRQLRELGAGTRSCGQPRRAGARVGITGVGQQITHRAFYTLLGQNHRRGAERVQREHACHTGTFSAAHDHHVFAPWALDSGRGNAKFKTRNRVQRRQRTKTNSHEVRSLKAICAARIGTAQSMEKRRDGWAGRGAGYFRLTTPG